MLERSFYDACLCADFGCDGYAGTVIPGTYEVSETTIVAGSGWIATTVYFGFNYYRDVG